MSPGRPSRPVLVVALALAAGASLGALLARPPESAEEAVCVVALAAAGAAWAARGGPRGIGGVGLLLGAAGAFGGYASEATDENRMHLSGAPDSDAWGHQRWRVPAQPGLEVSRGTLAPGDVVEVAPDARRIAPAVGPFTDVASARDIAVVARPDEVRRLSATRANGVARTDAAQGMAAVRAAALRRIDALGDPAPSPHRAHDSRGPGSAHSGLLAALLLGDRSRLDPEITDLFTRTGTRHLLALSGLHVGLVAALIGLPLARALAWILGSLGSRLRGNARGTAPLRRRTVGSGPILALFVVLYAPLAGGAAPAVRAAFAVALAACAGHVRGGRRPDGPNLWGVALLCETLADPGAPLQLGVQLSYGATFALLVAANRSTGALLSRLPGGGSIAAVGATGRVRSPLWRVPLERLLRFAVAAFAVGAIATAATLPPAWTHFGEWSPIGIVATPVILPFVAGALVLGYGWLVAPGLVPPAPVERLLDAAVGALDLFDHLPLTPWPVGDCPTAVLLAVALGFIACLARGRVGLALLCALATIPCAAPSRPSPKGLELVALDVGNGSAFALRAPREGVWLFDAGSRDRAGVARRALAPLLRAWGAREVHVVLSHGDADHGGALPWLCRRFPARVWAGASPELATRSRTPTRRAVDFAQNALCIDVEVGRVRLPTRGAARPAEGGLVLELVRGLARDGNQGSRSLVVRYGGRAILLSGDADEEGLAAALDRGLLRRDGRRSSPRPFDLVTLPHHGSATRHLGPFLHETRPREAWISGSRHAAAVPELRRSKIPHRITDRDGVLCLTVEPGGHLVTRASSGFR